MTIDFEPKTPEIKTTTEQMIENFAVCREDSFLKEHNLELVYTPLSAGSHSAIADQITIRLKNADEYSGRLVKLIKNSSSNMHVYIDTSFNKLLRDDRHFVWSLVASFCDPKTIPYLADVELNSYHSREMSNFFNDLYDVNDSGLANAIRMVEEYNARKRSGESPAFH